MERWPWLPQQTLCRSRRCVLRLASVTCLGLRWLRRRPVLRASACKRYVPRLHRRTVLRAGFRRLRRLWRCRPLVSCDHAWRWSSSTFHVERWSQGVDALPIAACARCASRIACLRLRLLGRCRHGGSCDPCDPGALLPLRSGEQTPNGSAWRSNGVKDSIRNLRTATAGRKPRHPMRDSKPQRAKPRHPTRDGKPQRAKAEGTTRSAGADCCQLAVQWSGGRPVVRPLGTPARSMEG